MMRDHHHSAPGPTVPSTNVTRLFRPWSQMSSPTSSTDYPASKRRKMSQNGFSDTPMNGNVGLSGGPSSHTSGSQVGNPVVQPTGIPKRGARACTACRKGKNRCEGEVRVLSTQFNGTCRSQGRCGPCTGAEERAGRQLAQFLLSNVLLTTFFSLFYSFSLLVDVASSAGPSASLRNQRRRTPSSPMDQSSTTHVMFIV